MPVPAVPQDRDVDEAEIVATPSVQQQQVAIAPLPLAPVQEDDLRDPIYETDQAPEENDIFAPSEARKKFKRCHGRCVQKFCLPVSDLAEFDRCTEKCKGICDQ